MMNNALKIKVSIITIVFLLIAFITCTKSNIEKKVDKIITEKNSIELLKECRFMMGNLQMFLPCGLSQDSLTISFGVNKDTVKCPLAPIIKRLDPEKIFLSKNMVIILLYGRSLSLFALREGDTTSLQNRKNKAKVIDGLWLVRGE